MSKNQHLPLAASKKKTDARVRRTRDALGDALVALMQEKPFDTITVQDVLDRAHVSRSTFYSHYSDKDDLLMSDCGGVFRSDLDSALGAWRQVRSRVSGAGVFHASRDVQPFYKALVKSGRFQENMELARGHFARGIERRLVRTTSRRQSRAELPAIAFTHAGALLSL
jgi:AcrR family transcriptional regulator